MNFSTSFSPAPLSYMAALRGVKPRASGTGFTYAAVNCRAPELLVALAASNPEGQFRGFIADAAACAKAVEEARTKQVDNVQFFCVAPSGLSAWAAKNNAPGTAFDYVCCDESDGTLSASDRQALFDFAAKSLRAGGLLALSYHPTTAADGALRFLINEFAPEMSAAQACSFLLELKKLGAFYFRQNSAASAKLDQAIVRNMPDDFFIDYESDDAHSTTFDTIVGLGPRGFTYVGDSSIAASYIELSVPPEAQQIIVECRDNPLYESIKDFAQNRNLRGDIWCKQPADSSADSAQLFGSFSFGITMSRDKVPAQVEAQGKTIALNSPLYAKLIDLMTLMPVGIGDILSHPDTKGFAQQDVVSAVQIIVACGIARPMRGQYRPEHTHSLAQPRLVGTFNQYLDKTALTGLEISFASPVLGDVMTISPRDALVIQALDRAGLANSVSALLPELQRLAQNPAQAARVMNAEPTAETARQMIEDAVSESIVQWYAYGLLEAA